MNNYTEELKTIFKISEQEALNNNDELVTSKHILLAIFKTENSIIDTLLNYDLSYEIIKEKLSKGSSEIDYVLYSKEILKAVEECLLTEDTLKEDIALTSLLTALLNDETSDIYKTLKLLNINIKELKKDINNLNNINNNLMIKQIATNLNEEAKLSNLDPVIGRDKEIENIIEILARKNKNNPLLIGEAGVGKTAIVEELARKIEKKEVPNFLYGTTIYNLNIGSLIAGTKYRGEFEEKLTKIIKELEMSPNVIVFIDEVHTIVGAGGAEGAIDASNILKPALARGKIKIIGATTTLEYKKTIEKDKALDRRFQKAYIKEPTIEETTNIINKIKKNYEEYHSVYIPKDILKITINLTDKYLKDRQNPDKTIDILDEMCAKASLSKKNNTKEKIINSIAKLKNKKNKYLLNGNIKEALKIKNKILNEEQKLKTIKTSEKRKVITKENLKKVLENKVLCPIYELTSKEWINKLENELNLEIIDQNAQIRDLLNKVTMCLYNANPKPETITIKGSTGTGKTTLVNTLAKKLKLNLITLDMKEFNSPLQINKIIGSTAGYVGYDEKNTVFESIKTFPISIILLENFNLADESIKNLINSIENNGSLKLNNNETINFNNVIIVKTETTKKNRKIGFISNTKNPKEDNTIYMNDLSENAIEKIITNINCSLNKEDIKTIIEKSDYKYSNAKNLKNLINEYCVKNSEFIESLWYNYTEVLKMDLLLLLGVIFLPLIAELYVNITYNSSVNKSTRGNISGYDVARKILDANGLNELLVIETKGKLTDHYDPKRKVIRLSKDIYEKNSVASVAVAAHEVGHALQDKEGYTFLRIRSAIFPIVSILSRISYFVIFLGFLLEITDLVYLGIIAVSAGVLFQLVTLPVEINASKRAMKELNTLNLIEERENSSVSNMLKAAALTYVASTLAELLQLIRLINIAKDN